MILSSNHDIFVNVSTKKKTLDLSLNHSNNQIQSKKPSQKRKQEKIDMKLN